MEAGSELKEDQLSGGAEEDEASLSVFQYCRKATFPV